MESVTEHDVCYESDELMTIFHLDKLLQKESLPAFPFLQYELIDINSIEEIRRTLVVANLDESVSGQEVLEFFGSAGEVKYIRFCFRRSDAFRYCLVEFSSLTSVVNGLKLNNKPFNGKIIKVYHSVEAIEKPLYIKNPACFNQHLLELKSQVEDAYKMVENAAKDVSEYENYCADSQPPLKTPLKNTETVLAEIENALSQVLSAQSLISVATCPVETQLLDILGETLGDKRDVPSSPECLLKFISQKASQIDEDGDTNHSRRNSSKSVKIDSRKFHRGHRSRSKERRDRYCSHFTSGGNGRIRHHQYEHMSRSHESRSGGRSRHSSVHLRSLSPSNRNLSQSEDAPPATVKVSGNDPSAEDNAKENRKVCGNEPEEKNDDMRCEGTNSKVASEKNCVAVGPREREEELAGKRRPSRERHSHQHHNRRSSSRSCSTARHQRRPSVRRDTPESPGRWSPPPSGERKRRKLHRRRSRSSSLEHHSRHHRRAWTWHSGSSDQRPRRSCRREKEKGERRANLSRSHRSPSRRPRGSPHRRDPEEGVHRRIKSHGSIRAIVVKVRPESYEDYLEEEPVSNFEEERVGKSEVGSGSGSQNSCDGGNCEEVDRHAL